MERSSASLGNSNSINEFTIALSSEILCNFITTIEESFCDQSQNANDGFLAYLLECRRVKMLYKEAAFLFNSHPKDAFLMLQGYYYLNYC